MFNSFRDGLFRWRSKRKMKKQIYDLTAALLCSVRDVYKLTYGKEYRKEERATFQTLVSSYVERGMIYTDNLRERATFEEYFDEDVQ